MTGVAVNVTADSAAARRDLAELNKAVQNIQHTTDSTAKSVANMAKGFASLVVTGGALAIYTKVSDELITLRNQITLVNDDMVAMINTQETLIRVSAKTYSSIKGTANIYGTLGKSMKDAKLRNQELLAVTETIQKSIALANNGAESANAAVIQLGQGLAAGALRGEELNSVIEQTPRLAKAIADELGVATGKLRELGQAGVVTNDLVFKAMKNQAAKVNEEFSKMSPTIQQAMSGVGTSFKAVFNELERVTHLSTKIGSVINYATKSMIEAVPLLAGKTSNALVGIKQSYVHTKAMAFSIAKVIGSIGTSAKSFIPQARMSATFGADAREAGRQIDDYLGNSFRNVYREMGRTAVSSTELEDKIYDLKAAFVTNWATAGWDSKTLSRVFDRKYMRDYIQEFKLLPKIIAAENNTFAARFQGFKSTMKGGLRDITRYLHITEGPVIDLKVGNTAVFFATISNVLRGLTGVSRNILDLGGAFKETFGPEYYSLIRTFVDIFEELGIKVKESLPGLRDALLSGLDQIIMLINDASGNIINIPTATVMYKNVAAGLTYLKDIFKKTSKDISRIWEDTIGKIIKPKGLKESFTAFTETISDAFDSLFGFNINPIEQFSRFVRDVISYIKRIFQGLGNEVSEMWNNSMIADVISGSDTMLTKVSSIMNKFYKMVDSTFYGLWDAVVGHSYWPDLVNGVIDWSRKLYDDTFGPIARFESNVQSTFNRLSGANTLKIGSFSFQTPDFSMLKFEIYDAMQTFKTEAAKIFNAFPELLKVAIMGISTVLVAALFPASGMKNAILGGLVVAMTTTGTVLAEKLQQQLVGGSFVTEMGYALGGIAGEFALSFIRQIPDIINAFLGIVASFSRGFLEEIPIIGAAFQGIFAVASGLGLGNPTGLVGAVLFGGGAFKILDDLGLVSKGFKQMILGSKDKSPGAAPGALTGGFVGIFNTLKEYADGNSGGAFSRAIFGALGSARLGAAIGYVLSQMGAFNSILEQGSTAAWITDQGLIYGMLFGKTGFSKGFELLDTLISTYAKGFFGLSDNLKTTDGKGKERSRYSIWESISSSFSVLSSESMAEKLNTFLKAVIEKSQSAFNGITGVGKSLLYTVVFGTDAGRVDGMWREHLNKNFEYFKEAMASAKAWVLAHPFVAPVVNFFEKRAFDKSWKEQVARNMAESAKASKVLMLPSPELFAKTQKDAAERKAKYTGNPGDQYKKAMNYDKDFDYFNLSSAFSFLGPLRTKWNDFTKDIFRMAADIGGSTGIFGKLLFGVIGKTNLRVWLGVAATLIAGIATAAQAAGPYVSTLSGAFGELGQSLSYLSSIKPIETGIISIATVAVPILLAALWKLRDGFGDVFRKDVVSAKPFKERMTDYRDELRTELAVAKKAKPIEGEYISRNDWAYKGKKEALEKPTNVFDNFFAPVRAAGTKMAEVFRGVMTPVNKAITEVKDKTTDLAVRTKESFLVSTRGMLDGVLDSSLLSGTQKRIEGMSKNMERLAAPVRLASMAVVERGVTALVAATSGASADEFATTYERAAVRTVKAISITTKAIAAIGIGAAIGVVAMDKSFGSLVDKILEYGAYILGAITLLAGTAVGGAIASFAAITAPFLAVGLALGVIGTYLFGEGDGIGEKFDDIGRRIKNTILVAAGLKGTYKGPDAKYKEIASKESRSFAKKEKLKFFDTFKDMNISEMSSEQNDVFKKSLEEQNKQLMTMREIKMTKGEVPDDQKKILADIVENIQYQADKAKATYKFDQKSYADKMPEMMQPDEGSRGWTDQWGNDRVKSIGLIAKGLTKNTWSIAQRNAPEEHRAAIQRKLRDLEDPNNSKFKIGYMNQGQEQIDLQMRVRSANRLLKFTPDSSDKQGFALIEQTKAALDEYTAAAKEYGNINKEVWGATGWIVESDEDVLKSRERLTKATREASAAVWQWNKYMQQQDAITDYQSSVDRIKTVMGEAKIEFNDKDVFAFSPEAKESMDDMASRIVAINKEILRTSSFGKSVSLVIEGIQVKKGAELIKTQELERNLLDITEQFNASAKGIGVSFSDGLAEGLSDGQKHIFTAQMQLLSKMQMIFQSKDRQHMANQLFPGLKELPKEVQEMLNAGTEQEIISILSKAMFKIKSGVENATNDSVAKYKEKASRSGVSADFSQFSGRKLDAKRASLDSLDDAVVARQNYATDPKYTSLNDDGAKLDYVKELDEAVKNARNAFELMTPDTIEKMMQKLSSTNVSLEQAYAMTGIQKFELDGWEEALRIWGLIEKNVVFNDLNKASVQYETPTALANLYPSFKATDIDQGQLFDIKFKMQDAFDEWKSKNLSKSFNDKVGEASNLGLPVRADNYYKQTEADKKEIRDIREESRKLERRKGQLKPKTTDEQLSKDIDALNTRSRKLAYSMTPQKTNLDAANTRFDLGLTPAELGRLNSETVKKLLQANFVLSEKELAITDLSGEDLITALSELAKSAKTTKEAFETETMAARTAPSRNMRYAAIAGVSLDADGANRLGTESSNTLRRFAEGIKKVEITPEMDKATQLKAQEIIDTARYDLSEFLKIAAVNDRDREIIQAGKSFAANLTQGFSQGLKDLAKGNVEFKDIGKNLLDTFTGAVSETFINGFTASILGEGGLKTALEEIGSTIFGFGGGETDPNLRFKDAVSRFEAAVAKLTGTALPIASKPAESGGLFSGIRKWFAPKDGKKDAATGSVASEAVTYPVSAPSVEEGVLPPSTDAVGDMSTLTDTQWQCVDVSNEYLGNATAAQTTSLLTGLESGFSDMGAAFNEGLVGMGQVMNMAFTPNGTIKGPNILTGLILPLVQAGISAYGMYSGASSTSVPQTETGGMSTTAAVQAGNYSAPTSSTYGMSTSSSWTDSLKYQKATGGPVFGAGTGTSDSIAAWLSNGEFVINAAQTAKFRPLLEAINSNSIPAFADGGIVSAINSDQGVAVSPLSTQGAQQSVFNINITGDVSRQTRSEIQKMIPQIAVGVGMHNREQGNRR